MNNFSPLPAAASDSRLSSPEAVAPRVSNPALQARRQKLRRIVAWIVGGATLLACAGLVSAAVRSHYRRAALEATSLPVAPTAAPVPVAAVAAALPAPDPVPAEPALAATPASSAAPVAAPKPAKKASGTVAHATKATTKTKRTPIVKSAVARH